MLNFTSCYLKYPKSDSNCFSVSSKQFSHSDSNSSFIANSLNFCLQHLHFWGLKNSDEYSLKFCMITSKKRNGASFLTPFCVLVYITRYGERTNRFVWHSLMPTVKSDGFMFPPAMGHFTRNEIFFAYLNPLLSVIRAVFSSSQFKPFYFGVGNREIFKSFKFLGSE